LASAAEQVWQTLGVNQSDSSIGGELLQLAMARYQHEDNSRAESGIGDSPVELDELVSYPILL
jgi:hypothetical protein